MGWRRVVFLGVILCACGSSEDRVTRVLGGAAEVPGAAAGEPIVVYAQLPDGEVVATTMAESSGAWSLSARIPKDVRVLYLGAVAGGDPERRSYTLVDLSAGTQAGALQLATQEGRAEPFVAIGGTEAPVDARTTAEAILRIAAGAVPPEGAGFATTYASEIDELAQAMRTQPISMCSVGASATSGDTVDTLGRVVPLVQQATKPLPFLRDIAKAGEGGGSIEARLRRMQELISDQTYSTNIPRLGGLDTPLGIVPLGLLRIAIWATSQETLNELTDKELGVGELEVLCNMIAAASWGNCREKAYLGAWAATRVPEIKQVVVAGAEVEGVGPHAVAIACLDGPEVYDMTKWGGTILGPPKGAEGRCFVVDPWAPALGDFTPGHGHVAVLSAAYANGMSWELVHTVKRIRLDAMGRIEAPLGGSSVQVCARPEDGEPSCSVIPVGGGPDAGGAGGPDAGGTDAGPQCPAYPPDGKSCGAQLDGCIEGFYCSTETIACEQTTCPPGSGRTYTLECCCNCWDDKSLDNVYDPCRAGFLLECVPAAQ